MWVSEGRLPNQHCIRYFAAEPPPSPPHQSDNPSGLGQAFSGSGHPTTHSGLPCIVFHLHYCLHPALLHLLQNKALKLTKNSECPYQFATQRGLGLVRVRGISHSASVCSHLVTHNCNHFKEVIKGHETTLRRCEYLGYPIPKGVKLYMSVVCYV